MCFQLGIYQICFMHILGEHLVDVPRKWWLWCIWFGCLLLVNFFLSLVHHYCFRWRPCCLHSVHPPFLGLENMFQMLRARTLCHVQVDLPEELSSSWWWDGSKYFRGTNGATVFFCVWMRWTIHCSGQSFETVPSVSRACIGWCLLGSGIVSFMAIWGTRGKMFN